MPIYCTLNLNHEFINKIMIQIGFIVQILCNNTSDSLLYQALFSSESQELAWQEQRIVMKMSSFPTDYPATTIYSVEGGHRTTLQNRAHSLFGESVLERFLKDYNKQTIWASVNVYSFLKNKESKFPKWLNFAVGYGSDNMYGGFENEWFEEDVFYKLDDAEYPRYRQFFFSVDIDLTRIKTKSHFLKTLLFLANSIKVPAPAIEFNTLGNIRFHPVYF